MRSNLLQLRKLYTVSVTRWSCATAWLQIFFAYLFIIIINLHFNINLEHSVAVVLNFWRLYRFIRSIATLIYDFCGSYIASVASVSVRVRGERWDKSKEGEWRGRGRGVEKETLARKPHDFEKLRSSSNVVSDWCSAGNQYNNQNRYVLCTCVAGLVWNRYGIPYRTTSKTPRFLYVFKRVIKPFLTVRQDAA